MKWMHGSWTLRVGTAVLATLVISCGEGPPAPSDAVGIRAAGGGGGGKVTVESTDPTFVEIPAEGQQPIITTIQVLGSGFEEPAAATFQLGSTGPTLNMKATRVVSGTLIEADVELDGSETIGLYDAVVEVFAGRRRKGIGTELLSVQCSPSDARPKCVQMTVAGAFAFPGAPPSPASATIGKEDNRGLTADAPFVSQVTVAFTNTVGTDADGNTLVDANCSFITPTKGKAQKTFGVLTDADKANLVAQLRSQTYDRLVHMGTDKKDHIGRVWSRPLDSDTDPFHDLVELGGNAGAPADVEVVSGNLLQNSSEWTEPLVLSYTGGRVRANATVNGQAVTLACDNYDEVIVTLERGAP